MLASPADLTCHIFFYATTSHAILSHLISTRPKRSQWKNRAKPKRLNNASIKDLNEPDFRFKTYLSSLQHLPFIQSLHGENSII